MLTIGIQHIDNSDEGRGSGELLAAVPLTRLDRPLLSPQGGSKDHQQCSSAAGAHIAC